MDMLARGEQKFKISPKKQQDSECYRDHYFFGRPLPGEEISVSDFLSYVELFALDSGPLRSNELSIHSLNY